MSCCRVGWRQIVGGRDDDDGGFVQPEEEDVPECGGRKDVMMEEVENVPRPGGMRPETVAVDESSRGST